MASDVVIVGGGPARLAAALTLGRARKRVVLCDAGPRRNAAAVHIQNFVTRNGITPAEFQGIAATAARTVSHAEMRDVRVFHGHATISGASLPHATTIGDFSKAFSIPRVRLGWAIEPDPVRRGRSLNARESSPSAIRRSPSW